jgi:hypothetical protein
MLGKLCAVYGWTLSRLMAEAENQPVNLVKARAQAQWKDPESGYVRKAVSPPSRGLRGELVEVRIPAGAAVSFEKPPVFELEHHLWMMEGALQLELDGSRYDLRPGDCLRYILTGPSRFKATGRRAARYLIAMVHP